MHPLHTCTDGVLLRMEPLRIDLKGLHPDCAASLLETGKWLGVYFCLKRLLCGVLTHMELARIISESLLPGQQVSAFESAVLSRLSQSEASVVGYSHSCKTRKYFRRDLQELVVTTLECLCAEAMLRQ